jgi:hypothetical protein
MHWCCCQGDPVVQVLYLCIHVYHIGHWSVACQILLFARDEMFWFLSSLVDYCCKACQNWILLLRFTENHHANLPLLPCWLQFGFIWNLIMFCLLCLHVWELLCYFKVVPYDVLWLLVHPSTSHNIANRFSCLLGRCFSAATYAFVTKYQAHKIVCSSLDSWV